MLAEYGVDPSRINLEITESSPTASQDTLEHNVRTLVGAGLSFSLDDYGMGYSNLTRAISPPFQIVKFDKTFAAALDDVATRTVLERSVSVMHEIGRSVLVEGVEAQSQADALARMGVDYIQGYLYSKPLDEQDFLAFLHAHNQAM